MERMYTYKFRLYPNREQQVYLANVFGCCRLVYNYFLNEKKNQYNKSKTSDSYNVQQSKLTKLRKTEGFGFLNIVPSILEFWKFASVLVEIVIRSVHIF